LTFTWDWQSPENLTKGTVCEFSEVPLNWNTICNIVESGFLCKKRRQLGGIMALGKGIEKACRQIAGVPTTAN